MTENTTPASEELYSRLPAVHRIDAADNISFIGGSWRTFAERNGCPGLADSVLGRSLWDYIGGRKVIEFNKLLFGILRDEFEPGDRITITGRCDSPDVHRDMLYELMPYGTGEIEIRSKVLRATLRESPDLKPQGACFSENVRRDERGLTLEQHTDHALNAAIGM